MMFKKLIKVWNLKKVIVVLIIMNNEEINLNKYGNKTTRLA